VKTKAQDLIKSLPEILLVCKHEQKLRILFKTNKLFSLFANSIGLWTNIAFYTNATINFFILMSYSNQFTDEFEPSIE
jgi:hypothetical protein